MAEAHSKARSPVLLGLNFGEAMLIKRLLQDSFTTGELTEDESKYATDVYEALGDAGIKIPGDHDYQRSVATLKGLIS